MKKTISIIIILLLCITLVGCKNDKPTPKPNDNKTPTESAVKIDNFDEIIINLLFTNDVAGTTTGEFKATIEGEGIIKASFEGQEQTVDVKINDTLVGLSLSNDEENGYIYTLSSDNKLYLTKVSKSLQINTIKYDFDNIDAIAALYTDLEGLGNYQSTVIIRSTDGRYYTDYKFSTNNSNKINEITRK